MLKRFYRRIRRLKEEGEQLEKELTASGARVQFAACDVGSEEDVKQLMQELPETAVRYLRSLITRADQFGSPLMI